LTLAQSVTDQLRLEIMQGRIEPNEKLHEVALSEMLGVSRTPVRAALHLLASEGLLDYAPHRGYTVRSLTPDSLIAVFDLRGVLEGLAARLAAQRGMSSENIAEFRQGLGRAEALLEAGYLRSGDREIFSEINAQLHAVILRAANDVMLNDMIRVCRNIPLSSDRNVLWHDYAWIRRSHDDHYRILEAIEAREDFRAEQLMREHVHAVKLQMKKHLEQTRAASPGISAR
jgi:GntR family transcriptional regulator of vanillate catabolism